MAEIKYVDHLHFDKGLEEGVLGACLIEANCYGKIHGLLKSNCFYYAGHQEVYEAIAYMWRNNLPTDILSIVPYMMRQKNINWGEANDLPYFITKLTNAVVTSAHVEYHALCVREMWIERELIRIRSGAGKKEGDTLSKIANLQKELEELVAIKVTNDWSSMDEVCIKLLAHMEHVKDRELIGVPTGFSHVDLVTGGLTPGSVTVFGARPSVGKSALLAGMALKQASQGIPQGILSLEMPKVQIGARLASQISDIEFYKIFRNKLDDEKQRKDFYQYVNALSQLPIYVSDKVGINVEDIKAKAAQLIYKHDLGMLWIDYLQLIENDDAVSNKSYNREQQVSKISRACKVIGMDFGIPIGLLSQLNRETEKTGDKKPQLHNLRESGAIEQDADGVIFLHRDWKVGITEDAQGHSTEFEADLIIAKWRNGELGNFKIGFDPPKMKFFDPHREQRTSVAHWAPPGRLPYKEE